MYEKIIKTKEELNLAAAHLCTQENFDELHSLAEKWDISVQDEEDFIAGKIEQFVKIYPEEKQYLHAEEKLMVEMWRFPEDIYISHIAHFLVQKSAEDSFEKMVLLQHKSLQKCMKYVMKKAYEEAAKKRKDQQEGMFGIAMGANTVYQWAVEYYVSEDAESEAKKEKEVKQKIRKERDQKVKMEEERLSRKNKVEKMELQKKKEAEVTQLSLFDAMPVDS